MKIVIFGAGHIGRSLVGQLFSTGGYEIVFVDVDDAIIKSINKMKKYRIEVRDITLKTIWVENIRAIHGKNLVAVVHEIATSDIMATAVGVNNLKYVYSTVARGILLRNRKSKSPLDIIICENLRNASTIFREGLLKHLPQNYPLNLLVGFVETSIGKMVPIVSESDRKGDPLLLFAEAYNKLIVDKNGFKNEIPNLTGIEAKANIAAYVDRKLFIHNMSHAMTAYLGYITDPAYTFIPETLENQDIRRAILKSMKESAKSLIVKYPEQFNQVNMNEYIDDLIRRFNNKALGDTVYRVGRDVIRKLSRNDRLIGAILMDEKCGVSASFTILGAAASFFFRGQNENGEMFARDKFFVEKIFSKGINHILREVCGLHPQREKEIYRQIEKTYYLISKEGKNWPNYVGLFSKT